MGRVRMSWSRYRTTDWTDWVSWLRLKWHEILLTSMIKNPLVVLHEHPKPISTDTILFAHHSEQNSTWTWKSMKLWSCTSTQAKKPVLLYLLMCQKSRVISRPTTSFFLTLPVTIVWESTSVGGRQVHWCVWSKLCHVVSSSAFYWHSKKISDPPLCPY